MTLRSPILRGRNRHFAKAVLRRGRRRHRPLLTDHIPDPRREIHAVETRDLLQSGRGRDVDFRQIFSNDIDANENQTPGWLLGYEPNKSSPT